LSDEPPLAPPRRAIRLAVVQPVMAPYARPVFERLAAIPGIALKVFVLKEGFDHRRGWAVAADEAFAVEVVGARVWRASQTTPGNRKVTGVRPVSFGLARRIAAWKPDVVMCTDLTAFVTLLPLKALHPCPIGILVEETELTASRSPRWLQGIRAFMYRRASFWMPYGELKRRYLKSIGVAESRMFDGLWSVDNALYDRPRADGGRRPGESARWITVGRLVPGKGFGELIEAWAAQGPAFRRGNSLWIVGEGPSRADLERQLGERSLAGEVMLLGHKSPAELAALYGESDAFVFPTLMDTWGLVVNEAMAAGLPVLCSAYAGCHLDLIRAENGVVFDPLDAPAFARALDAFWRRRGRWTEMGAASRRIVAAYTPEASAQAYARAARAAVTRKRPSVSSP
jgi:glycosyltransferase involved in cell wall biosynthesis